MTALAIVAAGIIWRHYDRINDGADPRTLVARKLYGTYNSLASAGDYIGVKTLLDSLEGIYAAIPHYTDSWESAVILNNHAALCLTLALYGDSIPQHRNPYPGMQKDSLIDLSERFLNGAMRVYEAMDSLYGGLNEAQIKEDIRPVFLIGLETFPAERQEHFLETRAGEILTALDEKDMRMSVCYNNLGIICSSREDYQGAMQHYTTALSLWDRNLDAENNLNRLLGQPLKTRHFLQRLFPPKRGSTSKNDSP